MQLTASQTTCPLCKHPVSASAAHSDPTRLCENCKRIVQTIRPTANPHAAVIDSPQARSTFQPQAAVAVQSAVQSPVQNPVQIEVPRSSPGSHEKTDLSFEQSSGSSQAEFGNEANAEPPLLDFDELFQYQPLKDPFTHEAPAPAREAFRDNDYSQASTLIADSTPEPAFEPAPAAASGLASHEGTTAVVEAMRDLADEIKSSGPLSVARAMSVTDDEPAADTFHNEVVTSPLSEPAQEWQYPSSQFPLMVGQARPARLARLILPLAAALLVCCGVAGYFLFYRPSIEASQNATALVQAPLGAAKTAAASEPSVPQASTPPAVIPKDGAAPNGAEQNAGPGGRAANESSGGGRYSLQAAAFPNEAGANEFCDRLKRAGVPAYTVSAEIAGRGRWFRVRVGRFETAEYAERFAAEARQRARASGLNLQLIVSTYETP